MSKEEAEEKENRKNRCRERIRRNEALHQRKGTVDKENENPTEKKEKRKGVKMGVRAFQNSEVPRRRTSVSSNGSWDAYVLDSSIKSSDEAFTYDLQETIPSALADRFDNVQWEDERELRKVRLKKDRYGSFGLEVAEGGNGGVFVENVLKAESGNDAGAVRRGDQLIAVNGLCLLNLNYADALGLLRSTGSEMEVLVSRTFRKEEQKNPVEREYMRSIRFDIAPETDGCETKVVADVERRRQREPSLVPREDRYGRTRSLASSSFAVNASTPSKSNCLINLFFSRFCNFSFLIIDNRYCLRKANFSLFRTPASINHSPLLF